MNRRQVLWHLERAAHIVGPLTMGGMYGLLLWYLAVFAVAR